jgi:hypothetical protein
MKSEKKQFISKALNLVLRQNYITFQDKIYKQVNGTAMGTPLGPQYANLFMEQLELHTVQSWRARGLILYKRFIDDIFALLVCSRAEVDMFILELNSLDPTIKLTSIVSDSSVDFLDITICVDSRVKQGRLTTKVFQKALNQYLYVPFNSYHTMKQKTGFIKGECIRYARTCTLKKDYDDLVTLFKARLQRRGYPMQIINAKVGEVDFKKRKTYLKVKPKDKSLVPFLFKIENNPKVNHRRLRQELDALSNELGGISELPKSLMGHITICYKLPMRLHSLVLKARKRKGF